jgi:hypothetical protein
VSDDEAHQEGKGNGGLVVELTTCFQIKML